MGVNALSAIDIATSGLRAQSRNMEVIANNIANSATSKTANGEPFRRQMLVLSTAGEGLSGVKIDNLADDMSNDFQTVADPTHPGETIRTSNVQLPGEMMNLVVASRAYQANAAVLKRYSEGVDTALELLR